MDARLLRAAVLIAAACSLGASWRTQNFICQAPTQQYAREFCETAERCRRDLAIEWLGQELPPWHEPCPMRIQVAPGLGAGGVTSFAFDDLRRPCRWSMSVQGSRERLIDSVIPHEVTHTIFATHFGRPLPRWADEGACTSIEADEETSKHKKLLIRFLTTGRGIAFNRMFVMTEYPQDDRDMLALYSQGYSVARYLIAQGGKQRFVAFIGEGMQTGNWPGVTRKYYGFADLSELQVTWLDWVREGCPPLEQAPQLAGALYRQTIAGQTASATATDGASRGGVAALPAGYIRNDRSGGNDAVARADAVSEGMVPVVPDQLADNTATPGRNPPSAPGESWYLRQRDSAAAQRGLQQSQPASAPLVASQRDASPYRPGSTGRDTEVHQSLSRPQTIGRPQQTVLDRGTGYLR